MADLRILTALLAPGLFDKHPRDGVVGIIWVSDNLHLGVDVGDGDLVSRRKNAALLVASLLCLSGAGRHEPWGLASLRAADHEAVIVGVLSAAE